MISSTFLIKMVFKLHLLILMVCGNILMWCNFYFLIKGLIFTPNKPKLLLTYHYYLTKIEGYQNYRIDRTTNSDGVCLHIKYSI